MIHKTYASYVSNVYLDRITYIFVHDGMVCLTFVIWWHVVLCAGHKTNDFKKHWSRRVVRWVTVIGALTPKSLLPKECRKIKNGPPITQAIVNTLQLSQHKL